jgi:hypothetical protein
VLFKGVRTRIHFQIRSLPFLFAALALTSCKSQKQDDPPFPFVVGALLYDEQFDDADTTAWAAEAEDHFILKNQVRNGALILDVAKGITIWNTTRFSGDVMFEFEVIIIKQGGHNDRASDLNCFWMASDPVHPENFFATSSLRGGIFWNYYPLNLYYVGFGGHDNSKTRMRKYSGTTDPPPVIAEYSDRGHLIEANKKYVIRVVSCGQRVAYFVNGRNFFDWKDKHPYREGYFGFRTVHNHLEIETFKVFSISDSNSR